MERFFLLSYALYIQNLHVYSVEMTLLDDRLQVVKIFKICLCRIFMFL